MVFDLRHPGHDTMTNVYDYYYNILPDTCRELVGHPAACGVALERVGAALHDESRVALVAHLGHDVVSVLHGRRGGHEAVAEDD